MAPKKQPRFGHGTDNLPRRNLSFAWTTRMGLVSQPRGRSSTRQLDYARMGRTQLNTSMMYGILWLWDPKRCSFQPSQQWHFDLNWWYHSRIQVVPPVWIMKRWRTLVKKGKKGDGTWIWTTVLVASPSLPCDSWKSHTDYRSGFRETKGDPDQQRLGLHEDHEGKQIREHR